MAIYVGDFDARCLACRRGGLHSAELHAKALAYAEAEEKKLGAELEAWLKTVNKQVSQR